MTRFLPHGTVLPRLTIMTSQLNKGFLLVAHKTKLTCVPNSLYLQTPILTTDSRIMAGRAPLPLDLKVNFAPYTGPALVKRVWPPRLTKKEESATCLSAPPPSASLRHAATTLEP